MRFGFLIFLAGLCLSAPARAQAPRDVLLEVCNQTGFSVAAAAAYRTTPATSRTLRSWFLIAPGECLNGALNGVIGDDLDLHVMSGSWSWPAADTGQTYCVPAEATLTQAAAPPCSPGRQARNFVRLPVEATSHRGPGGRNFGRVGYRIRCEALSGGDAALCPGAPADARGMAVFVRELEVCNNGNGPARVAASEVRADGGPGFQAWQEIAAGACAVIYRGFPQGDRALLARIGDRTATEGLVCMSDAAGGPVFVSPRGSRSEACPAERPVAATYETVEFRAQTGRVTMFAN
jgi:uncharacterized membrane protein